LVFSNSIIRCNKFRYKITVF